jgi:hypothetical protein
LPDGPLLPTILDVSASSVAGFTGWNESRDTVTAPPRMLVSLPPLVLVRVAQPEVRATSASKAASWRFDFMGTREGRWPEGKGFARLLAQGLIHSFEGGLIAQQVGLPREQHFI